jgi:hypothetical protein
MVEIMLSVCAICVRASAVFQPRQAPGLLRGLPLAAGGSTVETFSPIPMDSRNNSQMFYVDGVKYKNVKCSRITERLYTTVTLDPYVCK